MPAAIVSSIAGRPSGVAGILISRFGRSTRACRRWPLDRALGVVGEVRVDLERDPAVLAVAFVPHRLQDVAGGADVVTREREEDLLRVGLDPGDLPDLLVVRVALGDRGLEDRGVGRHADDALGDQVGQLAVLDEPARHEVDPDALVVLGELMSGVMALLVVGMPLT